MVQINDDFYEDLTPESMVKLLKALQDTATDVVPEKLRTPEQPGSETGKDDRVVSGQDVGKGSGFQKGEKVPGPGPMSGRDSCEPAGGLTSLKSEKWGKELFKPEFQ
jgi:NADH dehydrogenase (ubiquinone) flavoprotein 2